MKETEIKETIVRFKLLVERLEFYYSVNVI